MNPLLCASYRVLLTRLGYRVTAKTNPATALKLFRDAPDNFDLLVSDLTMPRITGVELAQQFLEIRRNLPVLLSTGSPDSLTPAQLRETGVRGLLPKPVSLATFAEAIYRALGKGRPIAARNVIDSKSIE